MSFTKDKESDNYSTDKQGWINIQEFLSKDQKIWSPFWSNGKQKDIFKDMGYDIIHEDRDFFSYTPDYDIIVANPPFSKWKEICQRLKDLDKPFIIIAFPKVILTKRFTNLFQDHLQIIIPKRRPTFTHLTNPKPGYTPPYGTWYMCYKMGLKKDLIFLK
jgi:type I restriction-modification system DNA methylase subunit